jgi:hypothetical protein
MNVLTKKCVFCPITQTWTLKPALIEVHSRDEMKAALRAFAAEVQRFNDLTRNGGGRHEQA